MKLIDKAAVVAEIKSYISNYKEIVSKTDRKDSTWVDSVSMIEAKIDILQHLLSFLDTIEVKEVDLEKEYTEEVYSHLDNIKDVADRMTSGNFMHHRAAIKFSANVIEKVLGLIGIKSQKGE